ncbi:hypothetical protein As57867_004371, partial [Aphanomyces stellatus]
MQFRALLAAAACVAFAAAQATPKPSPPARVKNAGACDTDADCKTFPGTVCVLFSQGDFVSGKCTPNYAKKPVCRGGQSGLCPQYQDPTQGYLNTQCVLVDKAQQPGTPGAAASGTSTTPSPDDITEAPVAGTTPTTTKKAGGATIPTTTAAGPKPPQIPGGRRLASAADTPPTAAPTDAP